MHGLNLPLSLTVLQHRNIPILGSSSAVKMMSRLLHLTAVAVTVLSSLTHAAPTEKFRLERRGDPLTFDYTSQKVRGVNLGGWFVLEPWITPSIFSAAGDSVVDEWTFCATLGQAECQARLEAHWSSWITEADFAAIAAAGLNHVRIPIGYWAVEPLPGDPYVQGQLPYMDQAVAWAGNAGLKVIVDLHGAPGSQNGYDNSGHYGPIEWQTGNTVPETITAIRSLASRYATLPQVTAIAVLNEPFGPSLDINELKKFYYDGWGTIRDYSADTAMVIHDAFEGTEYWNGFMGPGAGVNNVILDTHVYQVFNQEQVSLDIGGHVSAACGFSSQLTDTDKPTIVGEWTGATTDCTLWLNGRDKGARYDGSLPGSSYVNQCGALSSGSVSGLSASQQSDIATFIRAQIQAYEAKTGWIFWTWTTEGAPGWDMKDLLANHLFPQPIAGSGC